MIHHTSHFLINSINLRAIRRINYVEKDLDVEQIEYDVKMTAKLEHRFIVKQIDHYVDEYHFYIVTELCEVIAFHLS